LRLANLFYDRKQYDKAIEWYRRALELDSRNVNARTDLGTAYSYVGRPRDALREYRKSLETDPGHAPTLYNLILVSLNGTHDLGTARDALERLEKLNPNYPGLDSLKQRLDAAHASGVPR
jgi:tetratricopeptide (TPR) repeat protein